MIQSTVINETAENIRVYKLYIINNDISIIPLMIFLKFGV